MAQCLDLGPVLFTTFTYPLSLFHSHSVTHCSFDENVTLQMSASFDKIAELILFRLAFMASKHGLLPKGLIESQ